MIVFIRMSVDDFSKTFNVVELCSVSPDTLDEVDTPTTQATWTISEHKGSWVPGTTAGGSRKFNSTFRTSDLLLYPYKPAQISDDFLFRVLLEESSVPTGAPRAGPRRGGGGRRRPGGWGGWTWRGGWGDDRRTEEESRETEAESQALHGSGGAAAEKPQAERQNQLPLHRFPRLQGQNQLLLTLTSWFMKPNKLICYCASSPLQVPPEVCVWHL